MPEIRDPHPPVKRRVRGTGVPRVPRPQHRPRPVAPLPSADRRDAEPETPVAPSRSSSQPRESGPATDRGIGLLLIFTAGVLVMVALITLTAIVDSWWMLGPVMAFDFVVTAAVLAIIVRLLGD